MLTEYQKLLLILDINRADDAGLLYNNCIDPNGYTGAFRTKGEAYHFELLKYLNVTYSEIKFWTNSKDPNAIWVEWELKGNESLYR